MFPMTITLSNAAQLNAVLAALNLAGPAAPAEIPQPTAQVQTAAAVKEAVAPAGKPTPAKTDAPAPTSPTAEVAADAAPGKTESASAQPAASAADAAQASTAATEPVAYADVKPLILKINTAKGREAATAALAKFGVTKGPDLKPEQYADFVAYANEVLA